MSTAKRLAAPGIDVPGADGTPRTIRFDLRALARVEERLGSVAAAVDAITRLHEARAKAFAAPVMADLEALLDAVVEPRTTDDVLTEVAATIPELIEAIHDAWLQAWPAKTDADGEGKAEAPAAKGSRGRSSTGGRRSASAAATSSSGG